MIIIDLLLVIESILIFLFAGYEYLTLMNFPSLPLLESYSSDLPFVSIILPVRNQEATVQACIESLIGLDYPHKEIIAVDGNSKDNTREILEKNRPNIVVIDETPLPNGWVGKNWACHLGFKQAKGSVLLFTDGDSVHSANSLTRTVQYLKENKVSMVTIAPGVILKTFWEKMLQPPIFWLIMLLVGGKQVNNDHRSNAIGNGQYMLFDRTVYEHIGGHAGIKDRIVEDYALARKTKQAGYKLRFLIGKDAVGVRMYDSLSSIWKGWRKNFYTVSEKRLFWKALTRNVLMFVFLVLPFIILGYGLAEAFSNRFNSYFLTGGFMVFWLLLGMIVLYRSINVNMGYAFLFPLAIMIYIGIGIDSTVRGVFGLGFQWKGRVYGQQLQNELERAMPLS